MTAAAIEPLQTSLFEAMEAAWSRGFHMDEGSNEEFHQPSVTTVATEAHQTSLPEAMEAFGRGIGGFITSLFNGFKNTSSDQEEEKKRLERVEQEMRKKAMYNSLLKPRY